VHKIELLSELFPASTPNTCIYIFHIRHLRIDCIFIYFELRRPEFMGNESRQGQKHGKTTFAENRRQRLRVVTEKEKKKIILKRWHFKEESYKFTKPLPRRHSARVYAARMHLTTIFLSFRHKWSESNVPPLWRAPQSCPITSAFFHPHRDHHRSMTCTQ